MPKDDKGYEVVTAFKVGGALFEKKETAIAHVKAERFREAVTEFSQKHGGNWEEREAILRAIIENPADLYLILKERMS